MASRQEEKEARRRARQAQEEAERRAAARKRRLGIVVGTVLAAAIIAGVVIAIAAGGGEDDGPQATAASNVEVPTFGVDNLSEAAEAANCEVKEFPSEGREHVDPGREIAYETNPPTSGPHTPVAAEDGIYAPDNPPETKAAVHSLEHGRINFQYAPGTPQRRIEQLEALFNQEVNGVPGYHSLLFQNQTDMDAAVAATAWTRAITCPEFNDRVFDALAAFRQRFVDKGPELIP